MHKTDSTLHSHSHTRAYMLSTMDAGSGLVTGSHNALLVIQHHEEPKPLKNADGPEICEICGDDVGFTVDGEIFVACDECGFPVCRPCYEYERREGSQLCPQCKTRYKRIKGSPRVVGDEDEEDVDDIEQEFKMQDEQDLHQHAEDLMHSNRSVASPTTQEKVQEPSPENSYPKEEHTLSSLQRGQILHFASQGNERWDEKKEGAKKERINDWKLQQGNIWSETDCSVDPEKAMGEESRQPLSRKIPIASGKISPYRMVVAIRLVVLVLFLQYRVMHPVHDAKGIWLTSVVCEIWLALSWIIDQLPKWFPIDRQTYLERLSLRYEPENKPNLLSPVDIFVNTVNPVKEPPLVTANTILSILAIDYPVDKISCYVSDDGASFLTFEVLSETAEFSRKWVPFCRKYTTEPRAPEKYFSEKMNYLKDKVHPSFVKDRRTMKREYEEFKVRINALVAKAMRVPQEGWTLKDGTPWPGNNAKDHPGMIQVFLGDSGELDAEGNRLPRLVYVSREKRPGFHHYNKAGSLNALLRVSAVLTNAPFVLNLDCNHYVNNSKALREAMCFLMDLQIGNQVCFVQFPLRFEGIDKHDRYANRNTVFFDITLKGLDGIQGPTYVGTGCVFRRRALYGYEPKKVPKRPKMVCCPCFGARRKLRVHSKQGGNGDDSSILEIEEENQTLMSNMNFDSKYGKSSVLVASTLIEESSIPSTSSPEALLKEAIQVISCGYEDRTEWGNEIGWMYGSITEDTLIGFKMHCRGWRSIYCMPKRPAFEGTASINLSDRLNQVLQGAIGSIEIFFSTNCPVVYGCKEGKLRWLQRLAYIGRTTYPFTSLPLLIYCVLPAVCLLTDKFIMPSISTFASLLFIALFMSIFATGILEMRWSGVSLEEWWRDEQFWVIGSVSAHLFAIVQGLVKVVTGIDTNIMLTSNASKDEKLGELYTIRWTGLLIPPTTIVIINIVGIVAGITDAINSGAQSWGALLGKLLFSIWVIVHLYPFLKGLTGRQNRTPTLVIIWSVLLASIFSLLWVRIDPFVLRTTGPDVKQCGINC